MGQVNLTRNVLIYENQMGPPIRSRDLLVASIVLSLLILIPLVASQTSINVTTDRPQYVVGSSVLIAGKVLDGQSSVDGATVSIQVDDPQNTPVHVNLVYTDQSGAYSDQFSLTPEASQGKYTVFASANKAGLNNTQAKTQFTVISQTLTSTTFSPTTSSQMQPNPSKCLIATATYGSEMAPEVVMLRNFRDSQVVRTSAGRNFVLAFNTFYYSFSPQAATFISDHSNVKTFMKLVLYPMITVLSLAAQLDTVLPSNTEIAITISGIFAASGLGVVYLGIPLAMLGFCREDENSRTMIRWTMIACVISLGTLAVGEVVISPALLLIGSATVVLSFLALGSATLPYLVQRMK
jgi:peptide/nickel transport system substrate-binding protein